MFDLFGEFDSAEELNLAAAGQREQGDREALLSLAKENGIDQEDAEDYMNGMMDELVNPLMAAYGKLSVETAAIQPYEILNDWMNYIRIQCQENEEMARAVRKKGKSLKGCLGEILKWSFKNAKPVDADIIKAAGISAGKVTLGIPGIGTAKKIIKEYYLGGKEHEKE